MTHSIEFKGNDKLLFGIILGVLAFWFFAQTTLNINVDMAKDLNMDVSMMNIAAAVAITTADATLMVHRSMIIGRLPSTAARSLPAGESADV